MATERKGSMQVLELGSYPTRVDRLEPLCGSGSNFWVKHDDATNARYGGNKVRKLEYLLADASRVGARRIVTFGAAGSHHVLATTVHGVAAGFEVAALLTPLPFSEHARSNLRWALQAGLTAYACPSLAALPVMLARTHRRHDYLVPPGGSSATGSAGYADAAVELARQVRDGELPEPDVIVVALGSGGTVAGLLAGLEETTLRCPVHAVRVVPWPMVSGASVIALARTVARRRGKAASVSALRKRLVLVEDRLGRGYGYATSWGEEAMGRGRGAGLELEATYTAKACSHALRLVDAGVHGEVLYWHTLSSARHEGAEGDLPPEMERLWVGSSNR